MTQNKSTQQTKEEILGAGKSIPSNLGDIEMYMKEHCLAAMDEYAKQQAIAFMKWYKSSDCEHRQSEHFDDGLLFVNDRNEKIIVEELYKLFNK